MEKANDEIRLSSVSPLPRKTRLQRFRTPLRSNMQPAIGLAHKYSTRLLFLLLPGLVLAKFGATPISLFPPQLAPKFGASCDPKPAWHHFCLAKCSETIFRTSEPRVDLSTRNLNSSPAKVRTSRLIIPWSLSQLCPIGITSRTCSSRHEWQLVDKLEPRCPKASSLEPNICPTCSHAHVSWCICSLHHFAH